MRLDVIFVFGVVHPSWPVEGGVVREIGQLRRGVVANRPRNQAGIGGPGAASLSARETLFGHVGNVNVGELESFCFVDGDQLHRTGIDWLLKIKVDVEALNVG